MNDTFRKLQAAMRDAQQRTGEPRLAQPVKNGKYRLVIVDYLFNGSGIVEEIGGPLPLDEHLTRLKELGR